METEIEKKIKEIAKIAPGKRGFLFLGKNLGIMEYRNYAGFKILDEIF